MLIIFFCMFQYVIVRIHNNNVWVHTLLSLCRKYLKNKNMPSPDKSSIMSFVIFVSMVTWVAEKMNHVTPCYRYKPPPNEVYTESSLTVMKIQLPTGVEAYLEDLRQVRSEESLSLQSDRHVFNSKLTLMLFCSSEIQMSRSSPTMNSKETLWSFRWKVWVTETPQKTHEQQLHFPVLYQYIHLLG